MKTIIKQKVTKLSAVNFRIRNILFVIIILICNRISIKADSPLTSTDFARAYESTLDILAYTSQETLDDRIWEYLASPLSPIAFKMAVINQIGWDFNGKSNAKSFFEYLQRENPSYDTIENFIEKSDGNLLMCMAYLTAMDDYLDLSEAVEMARLALDKSPNSYTINIIHALIEAQYEFTRPNSDWCRVGELTDNVRKKEADLIDDMNSEAKAIIFEYMDLYLCDEDSEEL